MGKLVNESMKKQILENNNTKTTTTENLPLVHWDTKYRVHYNSIKSETEKSYLAPISGWNY